MQTKETFDVTFPTVIAERPLVEGVAILGEGAGVMLGVQRAFSARVLRIRDGGNGQILSSRVEIPIIGANGEVSGFLCHSGPRSATGGMPAARL